MVAAGGAEPRVFGVIEFAPFDAAVKVLFNVVQSSSLPSATAFMHCNSVAVSSKSFANQSRVAVELPSSSWARQMSAQILGMNASSTCSRK